MRGQLFQVAGVFALQATLQAILLAILPAVSLSGQEVKRFKSVATEKVRPSGGGYGPAAYGLPGALTESIGGCGATCSIAGAMVAMESDEVQALNDPFGQRVFREHASETSLEKIIQLLKGDQQTTHSIFVVHEWIRQSDPDRAVGSRRCVLSFDSTSLANSVMMSFGFRADLFPATLNSSNGVVEIWGWDKTANQFHYYELAKDENGQDQWVLSGSSPKPDDPFPFNTQNKCMECHLNGVPLMKELNLPWNNWEATTSKNSYLDKNSPDAWASLKNQPLYRPGDAENLEGRVSGAIRRYVRKTITANTQSVAGGKKTSNLHRLLRHLFVTTEFNLTSSDTGSGLTPFDSGQLVANAKVNVPSSFFLNEDIIAGQLGLTKAATFARDASFPMEIYKTLVEDRGLQMKAQRGDPAGSFQFHQGFDCGFPWFVPEASLIDNYTVERLLRAGIVTPEFVAAVQLVDLRNPVLSHKRHEIFATSGLIPRNVIVPSTPPADHRQHPLTKAVIERLDQIGPLVGTPLGDFRKFLKLDDPVAELDQAVTGYLNEVSVDFALDGPAGNQRHDQAAIGKWFNVMLERRRAILHHPTFNVLDETSEGTPPRSGALLPLP